MFSLCLGVIMLCGCSGRSSDLYEGLDYDELVSLPDYSEYTVEPIKVNIPEGKYWIACRDGKIDLILGLGMITGNQITVSPRSAMIIHQ